ncbi:MAG: recombination protein O N-terminal domain-containing protein [Cryomorphaceae bacterium]|nr:recombination protein O N-terminal domain-containing protein [Cryomorphaceae bacterium]
MKNTDLAFILRRINYSESSVILTCFTKSKGIQKYIFQGAKKKSEPFFPMAFCEITYYRHPSSELGKITGTDLLFNPTGLRFDPLRSAIAFFVADVLQQCIQTELEDEPLFAFLENTVREIDVTEDLRLFPTRFLMDFSFHLGIGPSVDDDNAPYFDLQEGVFSNHLAIGHLTAEGDAAHLLRVLAEGEVGQSEELLVVRKEAFETMLQFYKVHIPRFNVDASLEIIRALLYH